MLLPVGLFPNVQASFPTVIVRVSFSVPSLVNLYPVCFALKKAELAVSVFQCYILN